MRRVILTGKDVAMLAVPASLVGQRRVRQWHQRRWRRHAAGQRQEPDDAVQVVVHRSRHGAGVLRGVHKDGKNTGFTLGTDTWTCVSTTGLPLTGPSAGQVFDIGWNSEYYALIGQVPTNAHITMSLDGMSETGTAAYGAAV